MPQQEKLSEQEKKKIERLFNDKDFVEKAKQVSGYREFSALLKTHDIEISPEDLEKSCEVLKNSNADGEIDEALLEKVSGGDYGIGATLFIGYCIITFLKGLDDGSNATCKKKKKKRR